MFEAGKWYDVVGGGRRFVVGKTPCGRKLVVTDESGELSTRDLEGTYVYKGGQAALIPPPRTFEATVEVVALQLMNGVVQCYSTLSPPFRTANKVLARQTLAVQLTEGEGV